MPEPLERCFIHFLSTLGTWRTPRGLESDLSDGLTRLTNEQWGFDTNCFVCEPTNTSGLGVPFFHDVDDNAVVAEFSFDDRFSGAPKYVHGGVITAVLDEAMAWATIAIAHQFAVTHELHATYERPVRTGFDYHVRGAINGHEGDRISARAEITDHKSRICARTEGTFIALGQAQVVDATGQRAADVDPTYLRS